MINNYVKKMKMKMKIIYRQIIFNKKNKKINKI